MILSGSLSRQSESSLNDGTPGRIGDCRHALALHNACFAVVRRKPDFARCPKIEHAVRWAAVKGFAT